MDENIKLNNFYNGNELRNAVMLMEQYVSLSHDMSISEVQRKAAHSLFEHYRRIAICVLMKKFEEDYKTDKQIVDVAYMEKTLESYTK